MRWGAASVLVLAAALRAPGLFTDFWLDEIWALENVSRLESATGVFTEIHHDSNHWLTSLWMFLLGPDEWFWLYRLPSFVAGIGGVLAAGWLAELGSGKKGLAMILAAASFPLGFYASEARGYSLAVLAALLAAACLARWAEREARRWLVAYSLAATLGILAHLSFLIVLVSCGFFGLFLVLRGRLAFVKLLYAHAAPLTTLTLLVAFDLRYITLGGGPRTPPGELLVQTASLSSGGPPESRFAVLFAGLAAVVLAGEIVRQSCRFWRHRESTEPRALLWLFYAAVLSIPVWVALVLDPPFLFPRYFLVSIAFVPVLVAGFASAVSRRWAAIVVSGYLVANAAAWARFASEGRGQYLEALRDVVEARPDGPIHVGSDHDFRTEKVFRFYSERMGEDGRRLHYLRKGEGEPEFLIAERSAPPEKQWELVRSYPASSLSGARWRVYRRFDLSSQRSQE